MDYLNINNLPPEMLTKVFRFLDGANLKKATLTCKLWNNLIESTCRWSLRLKYDKHGQFECKYPNSAEEKMNFILATNRKFGKIEIHSIDFRLSEGDHQIYQIFKRHGFNVVELTMYYCLSNNLVSIAQLLNLTPNLTYANLYGGYVRDAASDVSLDQILLFPSLKKLKYLEIADSDERTIECFRKAKLTTMKIWQFQDHHGEGHIGLENFNLLEDFLLSQDMLTSLTVDSSASSILIELGKLKAPIPFRLTRLDSSMVRGASSQDYGNFLRFVQTQAESLTEMKMGDNIPSSVYECVFASMTKLNTLDVVFVDDSNFYKQLKPNCCIHTVKLFGMVFNEPLVADFLQKLPNIRRLILPATAHVNVLAAAAQCLNQLESLSTITFDEHLIESVTFPNLTALHIYCLRGKINWNEFTKAHSRLAELTIERMNMKSYLSSDDIDQITTNVDLQHIRLGVGFVADQRFFEIVRSKCNNLKVLDLLKSCITHGPNYNAEIKVLRLYDAFPFSNDFKW